MLAPRPIDLPSSCSFSDYFKFNHYPEDLLAHFGYGYRSQSLTLPQQSMPTPQLHNLQQRLQKTLPWIRLDNEMARREFLIAPLLMELVQWIPARVNVSFGVTVSDQLKGTLDYFLDAAQGLLVIEAKDENLERGFKQLAVELVALDQWLEPGSACLYGAVSVGRVWQFACLDRAHKTVTQDLELYRVPGDLGEVMAALGGILAGVPVPGECTGATD